MRLQEFSNVRQSEPSIQNVLNQDDVFSSHRGIYVLDQPHFTTMLLTDSVTGDGNEVEAGVQLDLAGQVSEKDGRSLQNSDQHDSFTGEVDGNLCGHCGNLRGDLVASYEDSEFVHRY